MRTEHSERLTNTNINKFSLHYLHYKPFHRDLYRAIRDYAKGNVLDIGCGNKPYKDIFGTQISKYVGCDIMQSHLNKVDVLCEANNIPVDSSSFETVFSTQTIEHVEDHQGLVNEAFRLLKPGGYFIVAGPFVWPLHEEPYDFFRFTKHGFKYILEKAGFEMVETLPNGGMWATSGLGLIHSFSHSKSKNFIVRGMRFVFFKLRFLWIINSIFSWLDKVDYNPVNTINYVVVAKKPQVNLHL
ncbi:MAG: class I SAM-dependent methyltransferase [Ginsengibacter sp.]